MNNSHLITMLNQIGQFFEANGVDGQKNAAEHIKKFWAPSMRQEIMRLLELNQADKLSPFMKTVLTKFSII